MWDYERLEIVFGSVGSRHCGSVSCNMLLDLTDKVAASDVIDIDNYYEDIAKLYQLDG